MEKVVIVSPRERDDGVKLPGANMEPKLVTDPILESK